MTYDPKRIYQHGCSFLTASLRADEMVPIPGSPGKFQAPLIVGIVLRAFALELYMKALLAIEGKKCKSHNLKVIFQSLSSDTQGLLKENFQENEFDTALDAISNAFEEWRYFYESDENFINNGFLVNLANQAKKVCEKLITID